jgi:hypothetical protein
VLRAAGSVERSATQRPGVKEGGREEESDPGISADESDWLRDSETDRAIDAVTKQGSDDPAMSDRSAAREFRAACKDV